MPRTSELSRAFSTALGKLESAVKKLDVAVANTRHMYVLGAAELAYAAALRCAAAAEQATLLARALRHIEQHYAQPLTAAGLAAHCGVSTTTLFRLFREHLGRSPIDTVIRLRMKHARTKYSRYFSSGRPFFS